MYITRLPDDEIDIDLFRGGSRPVQQMQMHQSKL